jgi:hypothetical protein
MTNHKVTYPLYRKYSNGKSFFKVISETEFEEIQVLGDKISIHHFETKILPDRNYISDLTYNYEEHWEVCEKEEFEALKLRV